MVWLPVTHNVIVGRGHSDTSVHSALRAIIYDWYYLISYVIWCMTWYTIWYDLYSIIQYNIIYDMIYIYMLYDMIWYGIWYMIWYMIWYDMIYDMTWHDMTWHDMIWYDMIYDMTYDIPIFIPCHWILWWHWYPLATSCVKFHWCPTTRFPFLLLCAPVFDIA